MDQFRLVDVLMFAGLGQGLFLAFSFFGISGEQKKVNRLFGIVLMLTTLMLLARIVYISYFEQWMLRWSLIPDTIIFLLAPLLYAYLRRITSNDNNKILKPWQFALFVLYLLLGLSFVLLPRTVFNELGRSGTLTLLFHWIEGTAIAFNLYFMYLCFKVLREASETENQHLSYHQSLLRFLRYFVAAYLLIICLWLIVFVIQITFGQYLKYLNYDTIWIGITLTIFTISYVLLKKPELLRFSSVRPQKSRLNDIKVSDMKLQLGRLFADEKLHRNNALSLQDISEKMGVSSNDVSWLINHSYDQNFYDFVNSHRLEDFKERIIAREYESKTILAMAYEAGFNSKTTFNSFFKQKTNTTPSAYIKQLRA